MKQFIAIVVAVMFILLVVDIFSPTFGMFCKVETGYVGVVSHFGKVTETPLEPGFHVKNWFQHVNLVDTRTQRLSQSFSAFSSDIQQVDVKITLNYNIDKVNAVTLYKEIGTGFEDTIIVPRVTEAAKIVFSRYNAEAIIANREKLSGEVLAIVQKDLAPYGINATAIAIEDIDFTDAFTNAVEAKQVATQEKLTAQTEEDRITMQTRAAAERRQIEAEADAEVARIEADAEAYSLTIRAEAEASANNQIAASLTDSLIEYTKVLQWNGELPRITGEATPIISLDTVDDDWFPDNQ